MNGFVARVGAITATLMLADAALAGPALAQYAKGDWHGVLHVAPNIDARLAIHIGTAAAGALVGKLDSPDQGVYDLPLVGVAANDDHLTFADPAASFTGTWDAAAGAWTGTWTQGEHRLPLTFVPGDLPPAPTVAGLDGEWDGALPLGAGLNLRLAFHVATGPHGTIVFARQCRPGRLRRARLVDQPRRQQGAHRDESARRGL